MSARRPDPAGISAGVLFVIVGVVFLLEELDVWEVRAATILPLLLIALGLSVLVGWATGNRTESS